MNSEDTIGTRANQLIDESVRLVQSTLAIVILYIVIMTLAGVFADHFQDVAAGNQVFTFISLVLGYVLTISLIRDGGLAPGGLAAGFVSYFVISILSFLAIVAGLLLVVIPGLFLMMRWAPVYGCLLAEQGGVQAAFRSAWNATADHFWPIAVTHMVPLGLYGSALAIYMFATDEYGAIGITASIAANLGLALGGVAFTAIGIAAYSLLVREDRELAEVFK